MKESTDLLANLQGWKSALVWSTEMLGSHGPSVVGYYPDTTYFLQQQCVIAVLKNQAWKQVKMYEQSPHKTLWESWKEKVQQPAFLMHWMFIGVAI